MSDPLPGLVGRLSSDGLPNTSPYACPLSGVISESWNFYSICQGFRTVPKVRKWNNHLIYVLAPNLAEFSLMVYSFYWSKQTAQC